MTDKELFALCSGDENLITPDAVVIDTSVFDELLAKARAVFQAFPDVSEVVYRDWQPAYELVMDGDGEDWQPGYDQETEDPQPVFVDGEDPYYAYVPGGEGWSWKPNWVFSKVEVSRPHPMGTQVRLVWYTKHSDADMWCDLYLANQEAV